MCLNMGQSVFRVKIIYFFSEHGNDLYGPSGQIASPFYPRNFEDDVEQITWRITVQTRHKISIKFLDLHILQDDETNECYAYITLKVRKTFQSYNILNTTFLDLWWLRWKCTTFKNPVWICNTRSDRIYIKCSIYYAPSCFLQISTWVEPDSANFEHTIFNRYLACHLAFNTAFNNWLQEITRVVQMKWLIFLH